MKEPLPARAIYHPVTVLKLVDQQEVHELGMEVRARLEKVRDSLAEERK